MKVNLSPAEIGAIVFALQETYGFESEEIQIADNLCNLVYNQIGSDFYDTWVTEFSL